MAHRLSSRHDGGRRLVSSSSLCPVGELVGEPHRFAAGVVVEWSVFGDSRDRVEVCRDCVVGVVS